MSNKSTQEHRPFSLTENDFTSIENSLLTLSMLEEMASELNPNIGAIQADQVCAFVGMVTEKLSAVVGSVRASYERV